MRWVRAATDYTQRTGQDGMEMSPYQLAFAQRVMEVRDKGKRHELAMIVHHAIAAGNGAKVNWEEVLS